LQPPPLPVSFPPALPVTPARIKKVDHLSVWQLVLAVIGLVSSLVLILLFLVSIADSGSTGTSSFEIHTLLWVCILFATTCIPSLVLSIKTLRGIGSKVFTLPNKSLYVAGGFLLLTAGLIYLVYRLDIGSIPPYLAGFLNILVIALPVVAWVIIGGHGLKAHSNQRLWGVFNISQFISTSAAMIIEILMVVIVAVAAMGWLVQQSEFAPYRALLQNQGQLTEMQIQSLVYDIQPLVKTPVIYALIILGMCLFVPMVEELLKPLGVWFLVKKNITPSEGFFIGLLGGAGFALVESLLVMGSASDQWVSTVVGRVGTGLLHVTTAGILGRAMAKSWQDGKYSRISFTYLGMILLHGTWNFFAILLAVQYAVVPIEATWISAILPYVQWVLFGLALIMIVVLTLVNHLLQKDAKAPLLPVTITPQLIPESTEGSN
jgi:hypothetical protein